jgi:nucleotide-binding universal stress UspA family protein
MKILLGIVSETDYAEALERTVDRADIAGDDLTVALVDDLLSADTRSSVEGTIERLLDEADVDVEVRHVEGDPGSRLVEIAETEGFDRIVLGGGQTSPMGKIKISTTAEFVLLNSHTSVTLVR